jgi:beta-glucanase (GH16 family)
MPYGQGIWPAIWMLPTDNVYGGWAASGEIDILEYLGHQTNIVYGTIHYGGSWPNNTSSGSSYTLDSGSFDDDFHIFTLIWEEGSMQWFVDEELFSTKTNWYTSGYDFPAPFDQQFHLILNLAVGGNWPGNPDTSTVFPQEFVIDYVRIYQEAATEVEEEIQQPVSYLLNQNYPNPFNSQTTIQYEISKADYIWLSLFDMLGNRVKVLISEKKEAGIHSFSFDAEGLTSGAYIYTLSVGDKYTSRKLILIK